MARGRKKYNSLEEIPYQICGARKRSNGEPCVFRAGHGTNHLGTGKCKFHGGASTGAKTTTGKIKVSQNTRKHGIYSPVLKDRDAENYAKIRTGDKVDLIDEDFYLIHAKLMTALEGDVELRGYFKKAYKIIEDNAEQEEIPQEALLQIKLLFSGLTLDTIVRATNGAANLLGATKNASKDGDLQRQNNILKNFLVEVLKKSQDSISRELAISAIASMKLDAGLPVDKLDELINWTESNH